MTVKKRDQYRECNDQPDVSLEDFRLQFCSRCVRPDCTRSQHGKSRFDQRVVTWESRLFLDVPRMRPEDPRFESFQAKRFREVDTGRVPEVQGWMDPRDLSDGSVDAPKTDPDAEQSSVEPRSQVSQPLSVSGNTPNQRGLMLGGKKVDVRPTQPVSDPWVPKKTSKDKVVRPGAKIKLGGPKPV